jgi:hypothetical protein
MSTKISVELDKDVFERLQRHAVPLQDDASSVVRRILDRLEQEDAFVLPASVETRTPVEGPPAPDTASHEARSYFRTSRGVKIPFGKLRASYKPHGKTRSSFEAQVTTRGIEFAGEIYDDPSPAGVRAKELAGVKGQATATNGWRFWEYLDERANAWVSVSTFRDS